MPPPPPSIEGIKAFQQFCEGEGGGGGGFREKGEANFWRGRFLETTIINFTSALLLDLLFTGGLKDVSRVISTRVFSLFRFI